MSSKALLPSAVTSSLASWRCDDPVSNGKHGRSALLWSGAERRQRPKLQLCAPDDTYCRLRKVHRPEAGRWAYLEISLTSDAQRDLLALLDHYAMGVAHKKCLPWFEKPLSLDAIGSMYKPICAPESETLHIRFEPANCNIWRVLSDGVSYGGGADGDLAEGVSFLPCFTVNGIYFKSREMGLSLTCTDVLVYPAQEWPFHLNATLLPASASCGASLPEHEEVWDKPAVVAVASSVSEVSVR